MNSSVCDFIMNHSLLLLIGYIFLHTTLSTAVRSLPLPKEEASQGYMFLFTFLNGIFRNVNVVRDVGRLVGLELKRERGDTK